jgi:beclin
VLADFLPFSTPKIEEEERKLQAAIQEAEKKCSEVNGEMKDLERKSKLFDELEERYTIYFLLISN